MGEWELYSMKTIIKKAETFRRVLVLKDIETDNPADLTECSAYSQMRRSPAGELMGDAECYIDVVQGTIAALWTAEQTAEWGIGQCGFDIWLVCGDEQKPIYTEVCEVIDSYTDMRG